MSNVATLTCKVRKNVSDKQHLSLSSLYREVVRKCQRQLKFCHAACIFPHPAKTRDNNRSPPFVPLLFFKLSTLLHTSSTIERQITQPFAFSLYCCGDAFGYSNGKKIQCLPTAYFSRSIVVIPPGTLSLHAERGRTNGTENSALFLVLPLLRSPFTLSEGNHF